MGLIIDFLYQVDHYAIMTSDERPCGLILDFVCEDVNEVLAWSSTNRGTLHGCASARTRLFSLFLLLDAQHGVLTQVQYHAAQDVAFRDRPLSAGVRPFPLGFHASRTLPFNDTSTPISTM